jgi:hypothetical protein
MSVPKRARREATRSHTLTIKSVFDLFPEAEVIEGISEEDAMAANLLAQEHLRPEAAPIFLGPQAGLKVIGTTRVSISDELRQGHGKGDVLVWTATDRAALEKRLMLPEDDASVVVGLIQADNLEGVQKAFQKAVAMDVDVVIAGILEAEPQAGDDMYGTARAWAEKGHKVIVLLAPDTRRPSA